MLSLCGPKREQTESQSEEEANFFWILFQFSLGAINDMGNCVPHACHSLHPIDWELNTQERAVERVTVYLWWWLQPINFDGCHFIEKTMGVATTAVQLVFRLWDMRAQKESWGSHTAVKSMQNWILDQKEATFPLEVIECQIWQFDAGSVHLEAQAWLPCDLQTTARTRVPNIATFHQMIHCQLKYFMCSV